MICISKDAWSVNIRGRNGQLQGQCRYLLLNALEDLACVAGSCAVLELRDHHFGSDLGQVGVESSDGEHDGSTREFPALVVRSASSLLRSFMNVEEEACALQVPPRCRVGRSLGHRRILARVRNTHPPHRA